MQECEGFLNGTLNYSLLKGDTGPLVYPAGFLYIYSGLYYITSGGKNIRLAQYIFFFIYLLQVYLALRLYCKTCKVPPYVIILSIFTSYRVHSIYILRLFNDPVAILFAYMSFNFFLDQKWTLGSIFFSLGISIKMNILLFAPAILLLYITNLGYVRTFKQLLICAFIQIILGLPFLLTYPRNYVTASFNIGRVFDHKWTVNYRFLDPVIFESKILHLILLIIHLILIIIFTPVCFKYMQSYCRLRVLEAQLQPQIDKQNLLNKKKKNNKIKENFNKTKVDNLTDNEKIFLNNYEKVLKQSSQKIQNNNEKSVNNEYFIQFDKSTQLALLPIFLCNLIGVACSRSLHYQFYVWYFHTLPYLTWCTDYSLSLRFLILGFLELCWNTYPSTNFSSILLHICHIILIYGIGKKLLRSKVSLENFRKVS